MAACFSLSASPVSPSPSGASRPCLVSNRCRDVTGTRGCENRRLEDSRLVCVQPSVEMSNVPQQRISLLTSSLQQQKIYTHTHSLKPHSHSHNSPTRPVLVVSCPVRSSDSRLCSVSPGPPPGKVMVRSLGEQLTIEASSVTDRDALSCLNTSHSLILKPKDHRAFCLTLNAQKKRQVA